MFKVSEQIVVPLGICDRNMDDHSGPHSTVCRVSIIGIAIMVWGGCIWVLGALGSTSSCMLALWWPPEATTVTWPTQSHRSSRKSATSTEGQNIALYEEHRGPLDSAMAEPPQDSGNSSQPRYSTTQLSRGKSGFR